jgi:hypothetical protein
MLSNYLPYKTIYLFNSKNKIMVYGRVNLPFPTFPKPSINLEF